MKEAPTIRVKDIIFKGYYICILKKYSYFSKFHFVEKSEKIPFSEIIFSLQRKNNSKKYYFFKLFFHSKWENNLKLFFQKSEKIIFIKIIFSLRRENNLKK